MKIFAERLLELRKEKNISQAVLAKQLDEFCGSMLLGN